MPNLTKETEKKAAAKPRPKHLVLDAEAQSLFNKAFNLTGADTEKQAVSMILGRFCELTELTDVHNPADIAEIERLTELTCDKVNCELNAELTRVNSDLTQVNSELKADLTRVNSELTQLKNELNELGIKLTQADLSAEKQAEVLQQAQAETMAAKVNLPKTFGRLNWLLLKWCAARLSKEKGKDFTPEQTLKMLFEGYLQGNLYVFTRPSSRVVDVFNERIKEESNNGTTGKN